MNQNKFALISISTLITLVTINIFYKGSFYENLFVSINGSTFEPFLVFISATLITSLIVLKTNDNFFRMWFRKFFIRYFPFTLFLTFLFPTSGYTMPHRYDIAVLFSGLMVLMTLIMVGYSYFSNKRPKAKREQGQ